MTSNKCNKDTPLIWVLSLAVLAFTALPALAQKGNTPS